MFQPLHNFFQKSRLPWDENDLKHALQTWLRQKTGSDQVLCTNISQGVVSVRVGSPALYQEMRLAEYDVQRWLEEEYSYQLKRLVITQRWERGPPCFVYSVGIY